MKGECLWRNLHFRCGPCGVHFLSKPISDKTCYFSVVKNLMQNCSTWATACKVWGAQELVYELKLQQGWVKVWGPVRTLQITNTATWNFSNLYITLLKCIYRQIKIICQYMLSFVSNSAFHTFPSPQVEMEIF